MARVAEDKKLIPSNAKSVNKAIRMAANLGVMSEFRVEGQRGLVLLVTSRGTATWYFHYDVRQGNKRRRRKHRIGRVDEVSLGEAISKADCFRPDISKGADPVGRQSYLRAALTLKDLAELRLSKGRSLGDGTLHDYRLLLERDIYPVIGHLPLQEVSRDKIIEVIDSIADRGATRRADTARAVLSSIFSYALDRGLMMTNPATGIQSRHDYRPRDVVATPQQIRVLWNAMEDGSAPMDEITADVVRLALLTGQRRSELVQTRVHDVTLNPGSELLAFTRDRTKNDQPHFIPLNRLSIRIVARAMNRAKGSDYLFPGASRSSFISPRSISKAMERTRARLGIGEITVHDLRRTMGSYLTSFGVPLEIRKKVFNHSSKRTGDVTSDVYSWYAYDPEKRAALELWGDAVDSLLSGRPRDIDGYEVRLARLKGKNTVTV